jgi:hypothetical protein
VKVGPKYRVTISQDTRKKIPVKIGEKAYLLARFPYVILILTPERIDDALTRLIGDTTDDREERKRAQEESLKEER